jgi:hypothetical protein
MYKNIINGSIVVILNPDLEAHNLNDVTGDTVHCPQQLSFFATTDQKSRFVFVKIIYDKLLT